MDVFVHRRVTAKRIRTGKARTIWPLVALSLLDPTDPRSFDRAARFCSQLSRERPLSHHGRRSAHAGIHRAARRPCPVRLGRHRGDRAQRHSFGAQRAMGGSACVGPAGRIDHAARRSSSGAPRDHPSADQHVSEPFQELFARHCHRVSGSRRWFRTPP